MTRAFSKCVIALLAMLWRRVDKVGVMHCDRPVERVALRGLDLEVPSEHVGHFLERLEALELRRFAGGGPAYYKLHTWLCCLVLSLADWQQLLRSLRRRLDAAEARAAAFYRSVASTNAAATDPRGRV